MKAPEHPASGAKSGSSIAMFKLDVEVQIAADAGDLSFLDFSDTDGKLEHFMRSCARVCMQWLSQQSKKMPATNAFPANYASGQPSAGDVTVLPSAQAVLNSENPYTVSIKFVSSAEMTVLNHDFRGRTGPTNVLSFAALDEQNDDLAGVAEFMAAVKSHDLMAGTTGTGATETGWQLPLGDIAICADIVRDEAQSQQKPALAHLAHMVVHGMLHLMGYDHESEQEAGIMEPTEIMILEQLGFNNPYAENSENS